MKIKKGSEIQLLIFGVVLVAAFISGFIFWNKFSESQAELVSWYLR
ncbi:MAG TPA: hypothetical protein VGQ87_00020 [Patescibacteria group bacterium]|nr:hypothetical protein [Patescibacteria group bacterium]